MTNLSIDFTANYSSREDLEITNFHGLIKAYLDEEKFEEALETEDPIEIGYIFAYRFDLRYDNKKLFFLADALDQDLSYFAGFFLLENPKNLYSRYLFYIDRVRIETKYRGFNYGIKALAVFLELFAQGQVVGCHPCPVDDLEDKYSKDKGRLLMKRYWSKIGLNKYNKKNNILWTNEWKLPDWLVTTLDEY
jgi:hypothetical protein